MQCRGLQASQACHLLPSRSPGLTRNASTSMRHPTPQRHQEGGNIVAEPASASVWLLVLTAAAASSSLASGMDSAIGFRADNPGTRLRWTAEGSPLVSAMGSFAFDSARAIGVRLGEVDVKPEYCTVRLRLTPQALLKLSRSRDPRPRQLVFGATHFLRTEWYHTIRHNNLE
jgi:hypothetical protein